MSQQIDDVDNDMDNHIKSTPAWQANDEILQSVPGVGDVTSRTIAALLPELGTLNRKQIASLAGLAPFNDDSGRSSGKRRIWGGRAPVRAVLYMAAVVACRRNPTIKKFYERLISAGKAPKLALVGCMRKLLTMLNAMLRDRAKWNPSLGPA